jgi:hypothetical protein
MMMAMGVGLGVGGVGLGMGGAAAVGTLLTTGKNYEQNSLKSPNYIDVGVGYICIYIYTYTYTCTYNIGLDSSALIFFLVNFFFGVSRVRFS